MTFDRVKTGEPIIVCVGKYRHLATVDRVTPTKIIVDEVAYNKQTGRQVGPSTWAVNYVVVATDKEIASVEEEEQRHLMINTISEHCARHLLKDMTTETLTQLYETLLKKVKHVPT
jgi:hypothetical protein